MPKRPLVGVSLVSACFAKVANHRRRKMSAEKNAIRDLTPAELEAVYGGGAPIFLTGDIDKTNGWTQGIDGPLNGTKTGWLSQSGFKDEPPGLTQFEPTGH